MKRVLTSTLIALACLGAPALAAAQTSTACPDTGGTEFIVDSVAEALLLAPGYANAACKVILSKDVTPSVRDWRLEAKALAMDNANIINPIAAGKVLIDVSATLTGQGSQIKAKEQITLRCQGPAAAPPCDVLFANGIILSTSTLDRFAIPGDPNSGFATRGNFTFIVTGNVDFTNTTVWAGSRLFLTGGGQISIPCGGGVPGVCTDPFISGTASANCPAGFPCTVTFPTAESLRELCIPATPPPNFCGGGAAEIRIAAKGDLQLGSITGLSHATYTSTTGNVLIAPGSHLSATTNLTIDAFKRIVAKAVTFVVGGSLLGQTRVGCLAGETCIDAEDADALAFQGLTLRTAGLNGLINLCGGIFDRSGAGFPSFNGVASPPYPASVILCLGGGNPGQTF